MRARAGVVDNTTKKNYCYCPSTRARAPGHTRTVCDTKNTFQSRAFSFASSTKRVSQNALDDTHPPPPPPHVYAWHCWRQLTAAGRPATAATRPSFLTCDAHAREQTSGERIKKKIEYKRHFVWKMSETTNGRKKQWKRDRASEWVTEREKEWTRSDRVVKWWPSGTLVCRRARRTGNATKRGAVGQRYEAGKNERSERGRAHTVYRPVIIPSNAVPDRAHVRRENTSADRRPTTKTDDDDDGRRRRRRLVSKFRCGYAGRSDDDVTAVQGPSPHNVVRVSSIISYATNAVDHDDVMMFPCRRVWRKMRTTLVVIITGAGFYRCFRYFPRIRFSAIDRWPIIDRGILGTAVPPKTA